MSFATNSLQFTITYNSGNSTATVATYNSACNCCSGPSCEQLMRQARRQIVRSHIQHIISSSYEQTSREVLRQLKSFTPRERALVSPTRFRPERTPSLSSLTTKLRWLRLDDRSVPREFRSSPSSRMTRHSPDSSWRSVLRHARAM